jgi:hypothetical protein
LDLVLHVVHKMALWRWWLLPILIVGSLAVARAVNAHRLSVGRGARRFWLAPVCILLGVLNFIFGTDLSARLIHRFGKVGQAVITDSYATGVEYNDHDVVGYNVLLKTADGRTVETRFQEDDFNVYPPHNAVSYPGVGDHFNISYLPAFPKDFIIIGDDDSPWALGLKCQAIRARFAEASQQYQFSRSTPSYRQAYVDAIRAVTAGGVCSFDEGGRSAIQDDLMNVGAGR